MKKEEKVTTVAALAEKFGRARLAILTECVGLPVNDVTELRGQGRIPNREEYARGSCCRGHGVDGAQGASQGTDRCCHWV